MKMLKALVLEIFSVLLLLPALAGAAPALINYQGRLVDANGNPLSGAYSITFSIYSAASGGSAIWTETQSLSLDNGIFSASLGASSALTPSVFSSDTRYLGVQVGADAEMTPRTQLLSVPYAIYAASAASVGSAGQGVIISTYVEVAGHVTANKFYGDGSALTGISGGIITSTAVLQAQINSIAVDTGTLTTSLAGKLSTTGNGSGLTGIITSTAVLQAQINSIAVDTGTLTTSLAGKLDTNGTGSGLTSLTAANISSGNLGSNVIASSISVLSVYTGSLRDAAVTKAKISADTCVNGQILKLAGGVWTCAVDDAGAGSMSTQEGDVEKTAATTSLDVDADQFDVLDSPAGEANISLNSSSVTLQGNTFNGASQLVRLDGTSKLPAVDGSALLKVSSVTIEAFYSSNDIRTNLGLGALATKAQAADGDISDVDGSKITGVGTIVADRIADGNLGALVKASSVAVNSVYDGAITSVGMSKLTQVPLATAIAYTVASTDTVVFADTSGGAFNVTLPAASASTIGKVYYIYNLGGGFNVTVAPTGGDTINGTTVTSGTYRCIRIIGLSSTAWIGTEML
ncbi:MAG: hypothetical protein AUJ51_05655 [Elusimicrobia bacterium CG1_02_56_21]|nr:MAG: hypothetical protein AUJ51_05655 [Elusimicrobia bacterium CG1_02_56_21]